MFQNMVHLIHMHEMVYSHTQENNVFSCSNMRCCINISYVRLVDSAVQVYSIHTNILAYLFYHYWIGVWEYPCAIVDFPYHVSVLSVCFLYANVLYVHIHLRLHPLEKLTVLSITCFPLIIILSLQLLLLLLI